MKKYIRGNNNLNVTWNDLTSASQTAVELAVEKHEQGYDWWPAINEAVNDVNYGNAEPEYSDSDFFEDEADLDAVTRYIELRYDAQV